MSHIHFIGGEKGGVGKSLVSRIVAQYFIDRGLPFAAFDTDRSHGALLRFYGGYAQPVRLDKPEGLDALFESAAQSPDQRVLVDMAAQTQAALGAWIEDSGVLEVAGELGIGLSYWHVMDAGRDSADLLAKLLDEAGGLGSKLPLVLVKNELRGDDFALLGESGLLARAEALGARVISLRKLPEGTMQKIDTQSTSFWAAVNRSEAGATGLGLLERQRVKMWLQKAYAELDGLQL